MKRVVPQGKLPPLKNLCPRPDDLSTDRREKRLQRTLACNLVVLRMLTGK